MDTDYIGMNNDLEDSLVKQVNGSLMMNHVKEISKFIRVSGTDDEVESLKYIADKLEEYGYSTKISFFDGFISVPVRSSVELVYPEKIAFDSISHSFSASTHITGLEAEVVDKLCPVVKGKAVLLKGLPAADDILNMQKEGALAVIYAQDEYLHNGPVSNLWGSPTEDTENLLVKIPVVSIKRDAGLLLEKMIETSRARVRIECEVDTGWKRIPMLEAEIKSQYSDKYILFSCHIDSWEYGAMDNGSANATAIEVARLMATQKDLLLRGLKVIFWAGHSQGRYFGSTWYADNNWEELTDNCLGHVNIDSTGGKDAVIITEAPVMPQTKKLAAEIIKKQTGEDFVGKRIGRFADQSFFGVGLTSIFGTFSEQDALFDSNSLSFKTGGPGSRAGGLGWWWHTVHDTYDKVDEQLLVRDTKIYAAAVWRLLTYPVLPYDFRDLADEIETTALKLQEDLNGRIDLSSLIERIKILKNKVYDFYNKLESISGPGKEADEVNEKLRLLSINLVRTTFVEKDCFGFDLSGPIFPLPSLTTGIELSKINVGTHRYNVLKTEFIRGLNRTMYYLRNAINVLD